MLPLILLLLWFLVPAEQEENAHAANTVTAAQTGQGDDNMISLSHQGSVVMLPLEDYVVGVTAAEMPLHFEDEAQKAQSVIARTYALWKTASAASTHENGADLCSDPGHCQAYYDEAMLRDLWGDAFETNYKSLRNAVESTRGQVLTYQGELAETYYHSTCGGQTASALEVWGEDVPYLQSVACKWDQDAPRFSETVTLSLSELPWLLGNGTSPCIAVAKGEEVSHVPAAVTKTESGRIQSVSYAGLTFSAADVRRALGLNSTRFTFRTEGSNLIVTTQGFGHGVGLCQYGANGMAKEGYDYKSILLHYYTDAKLKNSQKIH